MGVSCTAVHKTAASPMFTNGGGELILH